MASDFPLMQAAMACVLIAGVAAAAPPSDSDYFEKNVRPLLVEHCWKCHATEKKGGLRLDSAAGLRKGGGFRSRGGAGQAGREPADSSRRRTGELKMPPDTRLSDQQIAALVTWVKAGLCGPMPERSSSSRHSRPSSARTGHFNRSKIRHSHHAPRTTHTRQPD